jgi:hypothetical protein
MFVNHPFVFAKRRLNIRNWRALQVIRVGIARRFDVGQLLRPALGWRRNGTPWFIHHESRIKQFLLFSIDHNIRHL